MLDIFDEMKVSREHVWIEMEDEFIGRCGLTDFCVDVIELVDFVDFPEIDMEVRAGEKIGSVESDKIRYDIISPVSGRVVETNLALETDPNVINSEPLGAGWIFKIDIKEPYELKNLMNLMQYDDYKINEGFMK